MRNKIPILFMLSVWILCVINYMKLVKSFIFLGGKFIYLN